MTCAENGLPTSACINMGDETPSETRMVDAFPGAAIGPAESPGCNALGQDTA
jgi:hypothetical protein